MQRLHWRGALCAAVLLAGCAAERPGPRAPATVGRTALGDDETRARARHEEETQREIEAGERELRRERAEIESMRRQAFDRDDDPLEDRDDPYGGDCSSRGSRRRVAGDRD